MLRRTLASLTLPPIWQPGNVNVGERYSAPVTNVLPAHWKRAKDRDPGPTALNNSKANFRFDMEYNFPDHDLALEIHSVLSPTQVVIFRCSPKVSEVELKSYLRNVYNITTIKEINFQYRRGERWMDVFGRRWKHPDYMRAYVYLTKAVEIKIKATQLTQ
eukprot:TRINITY_DN16978_c0_g1_i1.p1 TRINITY_DN16978_c0_g1~~TRINITY_DN16978_c0_g1_i1.p1  ORF type:complete len:160 (+),score=13.62 TRINITY_DN16978_c0_g1_i1:33-512(+)